MSLFETLAAATKPTEMNTTEQKIDITYCEIDKMYCIRRNGEDVHEQPSEPNETEIIDALISDNWAQRFEDMRNGKRVRVSSRIYFEMLGAVPPIRDKENRFAFYCGEPYSGNLHYHFNLDDDGKRYGQLKALKK